MQIIKLNLHSNMVLLKSTNTANNANNKIEFTFQYGTT